VSVAHLQEALAIAPVVCVQNRYALDQRQHEPVLRACAERSIAFVPYFSLIGAGGASQAGAGRTDPPERHQPAAQIGPIQKV
jgi:aryl-alcohol dehydrogenase-like predicted oxidoreductase